MDLVVARQVALALDHRIFAEYHAVLFRPEFSFPRDRVADLLEFLWRYGEQLQAVALSLRLPDPDDAMFIEVAVTARADALVSGNVRHFPPVPTPQRARPHPAGLPRPLDEPARLAV